MRAEPDTLSQPHTIFYAAIRIPFLNDSVRAAMEEHNVWETYPNQPEPDSAGPVDMFRVALYAPNELHAKAYLPGMFRPAISPPDVEIVSLSQ